jgi:putative ABC transport system permease protein
MYGLPPARRLNANDTEIEGLAKGPDQPIQNVDYYQTVGDRFFETMGIRLLEGRFLNEGDGANAPPVAVINQSMERHFWRNQSAIGHRISPSLGPNTRYFTIVGVVSDVKNGGMDQAAGTELFLPYRQLGPAASFLTGAYVILKGQGDAALLESPAREVIRSIDPSLPVSAVHTMDEVISRNESRPRFLSLLLTLFSAVALSLAAIGIYGIVSYFVAQRINEIGIRVALGAQGADILRLVINHGMRMTVVGMAIGLGIAFALTRWVSSLFFAISATDPYTFVSISLGLAAVALAACFIPARRATRVDPIVALRYE